MEASMSKKAMWLSSCVSLVASALIAVISANLRGGDKSPAVGTPAPDFTLNSQEGKPISLHDFKGTWVGLYFYPKGKTTGGTREAPTFQRDLAKDHATKASILYATRKD